MVTPQIAAVRLVPDFAGVPFDPRRQSFHQNRRDARMAGQAQVVIRPIAEQVSA